MTQDGALRVQDLGPLRIARDGVGSAIGGARLEAAMAVLLIHVGRVVSVDALCEALWGDAGVHRSASTVDSHVLRLRRVLEPDRAPGTPPEVLLRESGGGYRLAIDADRLDSTRFVRLHELARAAENADAALRLSREALGLWRGRPFGAAGEHEWARAAVARLDDVHRSLREINIGALLATGAADQALTELDVALAEEPLDERLWARRITAYRQSGRRAEALRAYQEVRTLLDEELGIEPGSELRALHTDLLREDGAAAAPVLPARRSRLIGREPEMGEVLALLRTEALVSVVGTAGCGKTRLAVEVGHRAASGFPDGVCVVDLTAAVPGRVLDLVSSTLELPAAESADPAEPLHRMARARRMLLVLDNCEHVLDDVASLVDGLLDAGSRTAVLVTSREPLAVDGERVLLLEPLAVPAAVELFLDRLDAAVPGGLRDGESLATVREIAAAVDGLPLALELAAGRARAYSLDEIASQVRADASRLSRVGRGPQHHRAVRDAIDTSYRDLPPELAALHRAVGVVPGPFTADLAAALLPDEPSADSVANAVAGLVHRSLLVAHGPARPGGASRFAQFATVRGHAHHRAELAGEDPARRRDAWVERVVSGRPPLGSVHQDGWYRRLDDDLAGLRATLQHIVVDAPSGAGVAIVARLGLYWAFSGMAVEGLRWLGAAADTADLGAPADRAMLHTMLGCALLAQGQPHAGRSHLARGIAEGSTVTGDDALLVCADLVVASGPLWTLQDGSGLAEIRTAVGRLAAATPGLDLGVEHVGLVHAIVTEPSPHLAVRFADLHEAALAGDNHYIAWSAAAGAAQIYLDTDRPRDALDWTRAALRASAKAGLRDNAYLLVGLGAALAGTGDPRAALRVLGAAEAQYRRAGMTWPADDTTRALLDRLTATVGAAEVRRSRDDGARLTTAELIDGRQAGEPRRS